VICLDIRGFGKSDIPGEVTYSFSEDLVKVMDELKIEKANLAGLSLGAAIIIDFALTYPERIHTLILADAGISGDGYDPEFINKIGQITKLAKNRELEKAKQVWSDLHIFDNSRKNPNVWTDIQMMVKDSSCYRWYGENQPIDISPPAATRLDEIKAPTLVLVGARDIPDFQRKSRLLNEKMTSSELKVITSAGHLSNLDNPLEFNTLVEGFLRKLA
jgi:pimeloyl-ACP methyl ester carboxylesterase